MITIHYRDGKEPGKTPTEWDQPDRKYKVSMSILHPAYVLHLLSSTHLQVYRKGGNLGCIFFGEEFCPMAWGEAMTFCRVNGGMLAEPEDALQSRMIANLFNYQYPPTDTMYWDSSIYQRKEFIERIQNQSIIQPPPYRLVDLEVPSKGLSKNDINLPLQNDISRQRTAPDQF